MLGLALVVGMASIAYGQAAGAWVLWQKTIETRVTSGGSPTSETIWDPRDGFDQLGLCRTAAQGSFSGLANGLTKNTPTGVTVDRLPRGSAGIITFAKDATGQAIVWSVDFLCFPGTFDPRPRGRQ